MVTDYGTGGAPPRQGVAKDVEHTREILPLEAAGPYYGATVAIKDQDTIEPLLRYLDQIPHIHKPHLMRGRGLGGAFARVRDSRLSLGAGMRVVIEGDHLPDGGVAIAIAQGIQGHLDTIVPQQRVGV